MNINQLITLANLLDQNGEHKAAHAIDMLIEAAAEKNVDQDNEDMPDVPKAKLHEFKTEKVPKMKKHPFVAPQKIKKIKPWKAKLPVLDETVKAHIVETLKKLATIADDLDSNGLKSQANSVDDMIIRLAEELGITVPPEMLANMKDSVDDINNNLQNTIDFLRSQGYQVLDPDPVPESAPEELDSVAVLNAVFSKLAKIADDLDDAGATKEADLVDAFIEKHAESFEDIESASYEDEEGDGLGPAADELAEETLRELELLEQKKAQLLKSLKKQAEDPEIYNVVDWKEEADTERSKRYDSKHHHNLQVREPKTKQERVDLEGRDKHHIHSYSENRMSLSTRYCPEHNGYQVGRVGESTYQCPVDGKLFNWDLGFDADGEHYDGGSVAQQTPDSSGYGLSHRIFDTRETAINGVNS